MILEYVTTEFDENKSVKTILQREFQLSNRFLTKLKLHQKILVNGQVAMINEIPPLNTKIQIKIDFEEEDEILPQEKELEILYEDEYFLAVNKPSDLVVHPCSYHPENTLANYVKAYLNNQKKIRPINRLDKGTSGIVLFAKNEYIQEQFKNLIPKPQKEYLVITYGKWKKKSGTISLPIARKPESLIEREVNFENGQESITHYQVIAETQKKQVENEPVETGVVEKEIEETEHIEKEVGKIEPVKKETTEISLLKVLLETGRTHQIRVHLTYLGHPLLGDTLYFRSESESGKELLEMNLKEARKEISLTRQALHAYRLHFIHPITQKEVTIIAPLPADFQQIINYYFEGNN